MNDDLPRDDRLPAPVHDAETLPAPGGLAPWVLEVVGRGADTFYIVFQSALKSMGLIPSEGPPPEEQDGGTRYGVLPRRPGRWPELRVRLPESAVYAHSVEGLFRRSALWRTTEERSSLIEAVRGAALDAWPSVEEDPGDPVYVFSFTGGGLESTVKVSTLPDGSSMIGVGQKAGRLRFGEAERLLTESNRSRDGATSDPDPVPYSR